MNNESTWADNTNPHWRVSKFRTSRIGGVAEVRNSSAEGKAELDSHADTCVVSEHLALVVQDFMRPVKVHAYDGSAGENGQLCKTVSAVVAYDHPASGITYYLLIHQCICVTQLDEILLCPNQMRDNGIKVNDEPKYLTSQPTDQHHAITIPASDIHEELVIPLTLTGVTSYFPVR